MPLVSIIIPVYNREKTLEYCLNSVCQQSMSDFEVILVDDGSIDNSSKICQKYVLEDSRFHYYYKENGGVSSARNLGLSKAQGEWITFVDSDDYIMPYHLEITKDAPSDCDQILTERGHETQENVLSGLMSSDKAYESEVFSGNKEVLTYLFDKRNPYQNRICFCTTRFFKTSVIKGNQMKFREDLSLDEDFLFASEYQLYSQKLLYKSLYSYKEVDSSFVRPQLTCRLRTPEELLAILKANYYMFLKLYQHSQLDCVKDYGVYYFNNKLFDYLLIGYSQLNKWKYLKRKDLYAFINNEILPFIRENRDLTIVNKRNDNCCFLFLLRHKMTLLLMIYVQLVSLCRSIKYRL